MNVIQCMEYDAYNTIHIIQCIEYNAQNIKIAIAASLFEQADETLTVLLSTAEPQQRMNEMTDMKLLI